MLLCQDLSVGAAPTSPPSTDPPTHLDVIKVYFQRKENIQAEREQLLRQLNEQEQRHEAELQEYLSMYFGPGPASDLAGFLFLVQELLTPLPQPLR